MAYNLEFSDLSKLLAAKSSKKNSSLWLPLWMHAEDTAGIMEKIANCWLPDNLQSMIAQALPKDDFLGLCRFLGYTHDVGKASALFQSKIGTKLPDILTKLNDFGFEIPSPNTFRASSSSPHFLASETILLLKGFPLSIASIIGSHHGKPRSSDFDEDNLVSYQFNHCPTNYYGVGRRSSKFESLRNTWNGIWDEIINHGLNSLSLNSPHYFPEVSIPIQVLLTGMLIMADWIASNEMYFPLISVDTTGSKDMYPSRIEDAWTRLNLSEPWRPFTYNMDSDRFVELFGFIPNEVQKAFVNTVESCSHPGIFILEAQMGVGKTEAALACAEVLNTRSHSGGIFWGLPTQATANGIFPRLEAWAEKQSENTLYSIRLAHGMAELNDAYQALFQGHSVVCNEEENNSLLVAHQWFEGRKQALLANFVIGTVDQFLLSALKQKHVMLRHLGLAGKVLVIDECHAYDAYMNTYLERALTWMGSYKVPVILLSATLPPQNRASLINAYLNNNVISDPCLDWKNSVAYPLLTWTDGNSVYQQSINLENHKNTKVTISQLSDDDIIFVLEKMLVHGGCAGIIVNTVKRAQKIYRMLAEYFSKKEILLLHSHFVHPDRANKESLLLKRIGKQSTLESRDNLIVVGTQVLEQSLDIDFDLLITDLCPMDLLLQRIGRLHRHNGRCRPDSLTVPHCYVLGVTEEPDHSSEHIYNRWPLLKTKELLPSTVVIPDDIAPLVHAAYAVPDELELLSFEKNEAWREQKSSIDNKKIRASDFLLPPVTASNDCLAGFLEGDINNQTKSSEAAVRDGGVSFTVIVLVHQKDDTVHFLPWQYDGQLISRDRIPNELECHNILRQQLNLPTFLCTTHVISHLEEERKRIIGEWRHSSWLKDELFLFLNENLQTELSIESKKGDRLQTYLLKYNQAEGLTYVKKEGSIVEPK